MTNPTAPPKHLSAESKKLWRSVLADYEPERRREAILLTALEALDRVAKDGLVVREGGCGGPRRRWSLKSES